MMWRGLVIFLIAAVIEICLQNQRVVVMYGGIRIAPGCVRVLVNPDAIKKSGLQS